MILLIDNYDSFSYNLYQLAGSIDPDIRVVRNDEISVEEVMNQAPDAIILSPGPGRPEAAGICIPLIKEAAGQIPIFGVCLGHQAICAAFGGEITYASELMHGKKKPIRRTGGSSRILSGLPEVFYAARYHSLAVAEGTIPGDLVVTAVSDDDKREVMAVENTDKLIFGVQFHPESVMTSDGRTILQNFVYAAKSRGKVGLK
ncbi:MAG: aminodeoxychorismate/anthranilate synthase component II [Lachnospiraceae bacterium]|nr:aminodeoxychorismate/anthranilate synthase component II [Lachnospiraceae bacterium]